MSFTASRQPSLRGASTEIVDIPITAIGYPRARRRRLIRSSIPASISRSPERQHAPRPHGQRQTAQEALVDHIPIPLDHAHRMRGEVPPQEAAGLANGTDACRFAPLIKL